ncbi:MAG: nuclear transport factor 2 family protein [Gemmatimonadota bacterium]
MKRIAAFLIAISACRAAPVATPTSALTPAHSAAIADSVSATLGEYRAAFAARDIDATMRFYADDPRFRWVEDGELRYSSKAEVAAALRAFVPSLKAIELSYYDPVVTPLAPGVAVVATRFAQKITDSAGVMRGFAGAMSMTLIHGDSGWRFLVGHTSSLVPRPPTATKQGAG